MTKILKVGLIGYGFAGKTFHAPFIVNNANMELTKVASSDAAKVHADYPDVQVVATPEAIFADPAIDLVVIPTPNDTHFPLARMALAAGKHVVVDKPFTLTSEEGFTLAKQADDAGLVLSVYHNRRFDSGYLTLKSLFDSKKLGDIKYFEVHFDRYRPHPQKRWREAAALGSGIWYDLGSHLIDQALQFFGKPTAITADLGMIRPGSEAVDYFHAQLHYPDVKVVLHATTVAAAESPVYIVHGMKGSYVKYGLDPQENALKAGQMPVGVNWGHDSRDGELSLSPDGIEVITETYPNKAGHYGRYYAEVAEAIINNGPNPVTAQEGAEVIRIIEAGMESHKTGRTVTL
ncbi:oxidoreductase [Morganella morganii]|uniref:oxidoreductase n=2 Tax=Morganella morganii TaxID=582 RepID=UPI001A33496B|nr:oxidoreductase [Morganella morganii]MCU6233047.1 oxidoreductase [Morganella morganii]HAT1526499.1 oxidoreductase [Morganella morganii]HDF2364600.1 oxidoreductase [Morganella morganii]HDF2423221.1 oxidoreductase [Morganella morganii]